MRNISYFAVATTFILQDIYQNNKTNFYKHNTNTYRQRATSLTQHNLNFLLSNIWRVKRSLILFPGALSYKLLI